MLLPALLLLLAPAEEWSFRYANFDVITPEQIAGGAVPAWPAKVTADDTGPVISLGVGDTNQQHLGTVFVGRPVDLGGRVPRYLTVRLEYQADSSMANRTPALGVMLLTQAAWERLAGDPAKAGPEPAWRRGEIFGRQLIDHPEDAVEWLPWQSNNLATRLAGANPRDLYLVLSFAGFHTGATEFGQFRKIEVIMGDTVPPPPPRERQWPLKTAPTLHTAEQVALARQRVKDDPQAAAIAERLTKAAAYWLDVPFEDLTWRLADASVPRAFNDSVAGCPVHGQAIMKFGTYPWKIEFDKPFQITCPVGGESYPSNDFRKYYRSGYRDQSGLGGPYSDDGWGWQPEQGERRWMVAHANHQHWTKFAIPGVINLSRAYLLTGDRKYAHQAAAMLARIGDIYPAMDHDSQSRYGSLNPGYHGKILNHIWETGTIQNFAEAYDNIWETIDQDTLLQQQRGQTGEQIRALIETNVLEEGIRGILDGKIQGNFGMHQNALAVLVAVRQTAPSATVLAEILDKTGAEGRYEGIRYALYNELHRDGVPYETSPGYNFGWVVNLTETAELLRAAGVNLYAEPQFRRLLQWPLDLVINQKHTPALGDAGNTDHGLGLRSANTWRAAVREYGGPDFAWAWQLSGGAERGYGTYESLFEPDLAPAPAAAPRPAPRSRVMDGYGLAILNNPADTIGAMCYYGWRGGHSHFDGLTFDLYAHGRAVTPDTGYPDAMNAFVPGIYSWSKATISHNTVTVDARQQTGNAGGQVHWFGREEEAQYVDVEAPGNYPGLDEYRRALLLLSTDAENGYLIDVFRVAGGQQHDYSLHGAVGERTVVEGRFSAPQAKGTLAGENVEVGQFYDEPRLAAPDYTGGYGGYRGSGFQHLVKVQRQQGAGPTVVEVTPAKEPVVKLRMHVPAAPGQEVILAEARISPINRPDLLPYLLVRRTGEKLASTFVSVLDPFRDQPQVQRAERLETEPDAVALRVTWSGGVDLILQARGDDRVRRLDAQHTSDAALTVWRYDAAGKLRRLVAIGGSTATAGARTFPLDRPRTGEVTAVNPERNEATITWAGEAPSAASLVGASLVLGNDRRRGLFEVASATGAGQTTTVTLRASLRCGRGRVTATDEQARTVTSDTRFRFLSLYPGLWLTNETSDVWHPIVTTGGGQFTLGGAAPIAAPLGDANGDQKREFWVVATGPGDRATLVTPHVLTALE